MELESKLQDWVGAGIISAEQADAIRAAERPARPRGRISFVVEILGYLGGILATVAVLMLMGDVWDELTPPIQIATLFGATAALVWGGAALRANHEPAIERLSGFLWLAATATYAGGLFLLGTEVFGLDDERGAGIFTSVGTLLLAAPLWIVRRKALQQLGLFAALVVAAVFAVSTDVDRIESVWAVLAVGAAWLVLSQLGAIQPERTADAVGAGAVYVGLQGLWLDEAIGLGIAVLVMAAIVVVGVTRDRNAALAVGAVALLILVPQFITELFGPSLGATAGIAIVGLLIVAIAVFIARRRAED